MPKQQTKRMKAIIEQAAAQAAQACVFAHGTGSAEPSGVASSAGADTAAGGEAQQPPPKKSKYTEMVCECLRCKAKSRHETLMGAERERERCNHVYGD